MVELYKGSAPLDYIMNDLTYKEALLLRKVRVDRLKKERDEMEAERKRQEAQQRRDAITRP
ncbi:hypothetical protein D3C75_1139360 [compost metagenome]